MGKELTLESVPDRKTKICPDWISFRSTGDMKRRVEKLKSMGKDVPEWLRQIVTRELDALGIK